MQGVLIGLDHDGELGSFEEIDCVEHQLHKQTHQGMTDQHRGHHVAGRPAGVQSRHHAKHASEHSIGVQNRGHLATGKVVETEGNNEGATGGSGQILDHVLILQRVEDASSDGNHIENRAMVLIEKEGIVVQLYV